MNFYPRYPAHYMVKTTHLTMEQDGAYGRLLDWYYGNERAIPHAQRYIIARATKTSEKRAVDYVLNEFFAQVENASGNETKSEWVNERCEAEIAKAKPRIEAAKGNGSKGGRPRKRPPEEKPSGKPAGFSEMGQQETHGTTQDEPSTKPPQSPRAKELGKPTERMGSTEERAADPPSAQAEDETAGEHGEGTAAMAAVDAARNIAVQAAKALRGLGMLDVHPSRPELLEAFAAGASVAELADTAAELKRTKGQVPKLAYVVRTLIGRLEDQRTGTEARAGSPGPHLRRELAYRPTSSLRRSFESTRYQGTPDDELPDALR